MPLDIIVTRTDPRWDGMVQHLGYESVPQEQAINATSEQMVVRDIDLIRASQERLRAAEVVPDHALTVPQQQHLKLARAIASVSIPPVTAVRAAIIPPASDRMRTAGLYNTKTGEVLIDVAQLSKGSTTMDTVIHEIAHHTSQAEDMTPQHSEAMTEVAAKVVRLVARGDFDELLKGVEW